MKSKRPSEDASAGAHPFEHVVRSDRYLSTFESDIILVDKTHHLDEGLSYQAFDVGAIELSGRPSTGLIENRISIATYPQFVVALKLAVNARIARMGPAATDIASATITTSIYIFTWMIRNGFEFLSELTPKCVAKLGKDVARRGWYKILGYEAEFYRLAKRCLDDDDLRRQMVSRAEGKSVAFSPEDISNQIGLPVAGMRIPDWFRQALITGVLPPRSSLTQPSFASANKSQHRRFMQTINLLALVQGTDSISFRPYRHIHAELKAETQRIERKAAMDAELAPSSEAPQQSTVSARATPNLPITVAVKMLTEALKWVFDYMPGVLRMLTILREYLESQVDDSRPAKKPERVLLQINQVLSKHGIPATITELNGRTSQVSTIVDTALFSSFFLLGFNLGRRPNEVVGYGKPYGVHRGCCTRATHDSEEYRIEVYIEKSVRTYATSWCNHIVVDTITQLESLHQIWRPLCTPLLDYSVPSEKGKQDKLFLSRRMSLTGFDKQPRGFDIRKNSGLFFKLAGVDEAQFSGRQYPLRRTFISLYVRRFHCAELVALKDYMLDFRLDSLEAYYRDPAHRLPEDSAKTIYGFLLVEDDNILDSLAKERAVYLTELLVDLLSGIPIGGGFPRLVRALLKRFSLKPEFIKADIPLKGEMLSTELLRRGHAAREQENCVCTAGEARHTRRYSNCFVDGRLHIEDASPKMCHNCIHSMTIPNAISIMEQEAVRAVKISRDQDLPKLTRSEYARLGQRLKELAVLEAALAKKTSAMFTTLVDSWSSALRKGNE